MKNLDKYRESFNKTRNYSIGVEEEYMICDPSSGKLVDRADIIMDQINIDEKDRFSYELLLSEIEVNTPICKDVNTAVASITGLRNRLKQIGETNDFRIGISGTHPTASPSDQSFVMNDSYNWVSEQLGYYASRNITFSLHVHVSVDNADKSIAIMNCARRWIPALLALSTNSPFFDSAKTTMLSSRIMQFGAFPRTEIPVYMKSFESYIELVNSFLDMGTIMKPRQIWWKIRPHLEFGTLEFRICDIQRSLSHTKMLIALVQAIVHHYDNRSDIEDHERLNYSYLNDGLWKASRFNMNDYYIKDSLTEDKMSIKENIEMMFDFLENDLRILSNDDVIDVGKSILKKGPESSRQLEVYEKTGYDGLCKYLMDNVEY